MPVSPDVVSHWSGLGRVPISASQCCPWVGRSLVTPSPQARGVWKAKAPACAQHQGPRVPGTVLAEGQDAERDTRFPRPDGAHILMGEIFIFFKVN